MPGIPPGWPSELPPPRTDEFAARVQGWLLDLGPAEFRSHKVLRRHPQVLAWAVQRYLEAALTASREIYSHTRARYREELPATTVTEVLQAFEFEGVRLRRALREVGLVADALGGVKWSERL